MRNGESNWRIFGVFTSHARAYTKKRQSFKENRRLGNGHIYGIRCQMDNACCWIAICRFHTLTVSTINIYANLSRTIWAHEKQVKIEFNSLRNVYAKNGMIFTTFSDTFHVCACTLEVNLIFFLQWTLLFILKTRFVFPACALCGQNRIEKRERMEVEKRVLLTQHTNPYRTRTELGVFRCCTSI